MTEDATAYDVDGAIRTVRGKKIILDRFWGEGTPRPLRGARTDAPVPEAE